MCRESGAVLAMDDLQKLLWLSNWCRRAGVFQDGQSESYHVGTGSEERK